MPTFRYWYLDDKEDPEHDETVNGLDAQEAAEAAVEEMINDGDCDFPSSDKIELAVRLLPDGPAEMFEIFVDWSPNATAYSRGPLPEKADGEVAENLEG